ncbi:MULTISPECIES: DUF3310 domain-containing protein [unclassified Streptomyces]|uniref:DUF3310 domain-containing protein n=1 Tax=unclassified Streptomyces TaxID=2593676 RepID=UPI0035DBD8E1
MSYTVDDKVIILTGENKGKRGRVVSVNVDALYPIYVKVYGSVVRYVWYRETEIRPVSVVIPEKPTDAVNHPSHYTWLPNGVEVIDITALFNFTLGNVLKYLLRAGRKGAALEDLKKARWYLDYEISRMENTK